MKINVERAALLDAVSRLQKVVGSKTSMPVLDGILMTAQKGCLSLCAYNLEMGMKKEIYALCEEEGAIVINARLLADILRRMNGPQVNIETDERLMCHILCNESVFDIMGMDATDFPEMPSVSEGEKASINGEILTDMVRGTIFAVSQIEGTRPILTGIYVSVKENVLQMVAIDGYRLAIRRHKVETSAETEFVMTGKAMNEAVKLIDENTENVEITVGKRLVSFDINGYVFISRLLEGEFVNFVKIIPDEYKQSAVLNSNEITDAVERASLLINDTFSTPVRWIFKDETLTVSCTTAMGRATEKLPVALEGESFEIGMNSRYLLDALKACDSGDILFRFNGSDAGIVIRSADESNKDFLYLVMPMRLK